MNQSKCCVCQKPAAAIVSTGIAPMSDAYCLTCSKAGLQPWHALVAVASCIGAQSLDDCAPHFRHAIEETTAWMQANLEPTKQKCQDDLWKAVRGKNT